MRKMFFFVTVGFQNRKGTISQTDYNSIVYKPFVGNAHCRFALKPDPELKERWNMGYQCLPFKQPKNWMGSKHFKNWERLGELMFCIEMWPPEIDD